MPYFQQGFGDSLSGKQISHVSLFSSVWSLNNQPAKQPTKTKNPKLRTEREEKQRGYKTNVFSFS